jgi:hypothetical protein
VRIGEANVAPVSGTTSRPPPSVSRLAVSPTPVIEIGTGTALASGPTSMSSFAVIV